MKLASRSGSRDFMTTQRRFRSPSREKRRQARPQPPKMFPGPPSPHHRSARYQEFTGNDFWPGRSQTEHHKLQASQSTFTAAMRAGKQHADFPEHTVSRKELREMAYSMPKHTQHNPPLRYGHSSARTRAQTPVLYREIMPRKQTPFTQERPPSKDAAISPDDPPKVHSPNREVRFVNQADDKYGPAAADGPTPPVVQSFQGGRSRAPRPLEWVRRKGKNIFANPTTKCDAATHQELSRQVQRLNRQLQAHLAQSHCYPYAEDADALPWWYGDEFHGALPPPPCPCVYRRFQEAGHSHYSVLPSRHTRNCPYMPPFEYSVPDHRDICPVGGPEMRDRYTPTDLREPFSSGPAEPGDDFPPLPIEEDLSRPPPPPSDYFDDKPFFPPPSYQPPWMDINCYGGEDYPWGRSKKAYPPWNRPPRDVFGGRPPMVVRTILPPPPKRLGKRREPSASLWNLPDDPPWRKALKRGFPSKCYCGPLRGGAELENWMERCEFCQATRNAPDETHTKASKVILSALEGLKNKSEIKDVLEAVRRYEQQLRQQTKEAFDTETTATGNELDSTVFQTNGDFLHRPYDSTHGLYADRHQHKSSQTIPRAAGGFRTPTPNAYSPDPRQWTLVNDARDELSALGTTDNLSTEEFKVNCSGGDSEDNYYMSQYKIPSKRNRHTVSIWGIDTGSPARMYSGNEEWRIIT